MKKRLLTMISFLLVVLFAFNMQAQTIVTGYVENFDSPVDLALWSPSSVVHDDSTKAFDVTQAGGVLHVDVNQKNFWDGQLYNFTKAENIIIDMTADPVISFDMKVEAGATYGGVATDTVFLLVSPFGQDTSGALKREVLAVKIGMPSDGQWHSYTYDIGANLGELEWNGDVLENDLTEVEAVLLEPVIYPEKYVYTYEMDNFKVGTPTPAPTLITGVEENFEGTLDMALWNPSTVVHDDGSPAFAVSQVGGVLHVDVKQKNFWDGQLYNFTKVNNTIIDMTADPVISFDMMIEAGASYDGVAVDSVDLLVSPFGKDSIGDLKREVLAVKMTLPADGQWHSYSYNIGANLGELEWNGDVLENDLTEVEAVLFESVKYPGVYAYTYEMDNFLMGTSAVIPPTVVTSYSEDFSDAVDMALWNPSSVAHPDGTPAFDVTQADGVLNIAVNQVNFWDGQPYSITANENVIIDMSGNPYISFDIKVEEGATYDSVAVDTVYILVSPFGQDTSGALKREVLAVKMGLPADGEWHNYLYDIGANLGELEWNGDVLENDLTEVEMILVEPVIYPGKYSYNYQMDNFKVGDAAAPPTVVTGYSEDFDDAVDMALWNPSSVAHPDGTPAFDVTQADGVLNVAVNQVNFWDGQPYSITANENVIIDMSGNPYISFDIKVEEGATYDSVAVDTVYILVSPFGQDTTGALKREVLAVKMGLPADGQWHNYLYDIGANLGELEWNGDVLENDLTEVEMILVEPVIYPGKYSYNYQMDNFKVGDATVTEPTVVTSYSENFDDAVDMALWNPSSVAHPDGTPAFDVTQADGVLNIAVNQVNFWDGQAYSITANEDVIIDMSGNPYISFDIKVEEGATYDSVAVDTVYILVSPFGQDTTGALKREVLAVKMGLPADGQWHSYLYDIGANLGELEWNGDVLENDLTEVEMILVEPVIYPGKYSYNYQMDNFKVGDAAVPYNPGEPLLTYQVPQVDNKFWAQWTVSPTHAPMNGATGLSMGEVEAWGDFGAIVRFNSDGFIDAYNGSTYEKANDVAYEKNVEYTIEVIGDVVAQTYSVSVSAPGIQKTIIGENFVFRSSTTQTAINFMNMKIEENTAWGGVPGARLRPSFVDGDYILGFYNEKASELNMTAEHNVSMTATPTALGINTAVALSKEQPGLLAWGELSAIIRFNGAGKIDVRNGANYESLVDMDYEEGKSYTIDMKVDVPNQKYDVVVTPDGGSAVTLATDYGFRADADLLNFAIKQNLIGGDFGGTVGDLQISDIVVTTVGTADIDLPKFSFYPNPAEELLVVQTGDQATKIEIVSVTGVVLQTIATRPNSTETVNVSGLSSGAYILNVHSDKGHSAKLFVKK